MAEDNDNQELNALRKALAVKAFKVVKKQRIPKGDLEKYTRVSFNDYIAANRVLENVSEDVVLARLNAVEGRDDLLSLMAVEYMIKNAPLKEVKDNIINAVQDGKNINEVAQYACKEFQRTLSDRKFEDLLTDFATNIRNKISRDIISQLKSSDVKNRLAKTTNPDELMLLFIASRLIAKFKRTDPDVEKVMLEAIDNEQDLGKLIDGTLMRYYQSVPEDAKKSAFEQIQKFAYKQAEEDFYSEKKEKLDTMRVYTLRGTFWRTVFGTIAATALTGWLMFSIFSGQAEKYYAKFAHKLPAATAFESGLRKYLDEAVELELKEPLKGPALLNIDAKATAEFGAIISMEELSGNPRRPDAELISRKVDLLMEFARKYSGTSQGSSAAEKAALLVYLNNDTVKNREITPLLEQMLESNSNIPQAIEWYYNTAIKGKGEQFAASKTLEWITAVKDSTKNPKTKAELAYILASTHSVSASEMLDSSYLRSLCTKMRPELEASKSAASPFIALCKESMRDNETAARASCLIGKHYEEARNEAEMIRWYRRAVEYSRKSECPLSAPMKQQIAAAYLKLGKAYFEAKYYEKASEMLAMAEDLSPSLEKEIKKLKESAESRRSKEFWQSVRD